MQFFIRGAASHEWQEFLACFPPHLRDIHFDSDYNGVQELLGGEALLFGLDAGEHGLVAQAVIKRPSEAGYCDIASPYGYGGLIASSDNATDRLLTSLDFERSVEQWASGSRVISEYARLHPLFLDPMAAMLPASAVNNFKPVVIVNLKKVSIDTVARRVRRGLDKAKDVIFGEVDKDAHSNAAFASLYADSMRRKNADERLRFPAKYISALFGLPGSRHFCVANGRGLRRLMVLNRYGAAYAHLLASDGENRHAGLDETLYFRTAEQLANEGCERFHLGGGLTDSPHDPLLLFKAGFAAPAYLTASYSRIFDAAAYDTACAAKRQQEFNQLGRESTSTFFPQYRRPTI